MVVLSMPTGFRLEAMCQIHDRRKEKSWDTTYCLLFAGCGPVVKQWGTFWMFLSSAKIYRSVQHWCCVMHIMWKHAGIRPHIEQYRKKGLDEEWKKRGRDTDQS